MQSDFEVALEQFQKNPGIYFKEILDVQTLQEYQERCIQTIADNERTAIRACHDLGKTFLVARVVSWFLSCYKYSKVITTAPTYNQVKNILWSEIRSANSRSKFPLGGTMNLTEWQIDDGWFAIGFTPRNEAMTSSGQGTQSSFQGFHAEGGVLVVFDEATGIPANIWTMAEGLLTSSNVKFVAIGNPTSTASEFYHCFKSPAWAKVCLTCFDSPNLIANGITNKEQLISEIEKVRSMSDLEANAYLDNYVAPIPYLLTLKWVVQNVMRWGIDHPLTVSKIFGEFPVAGDNTLMPLGFVESSQLRVAYPTDSDRKCIGVDVARFGTDSTVLTALHGPKQLARKEYYKNDALQVVGETINMSREIGGADIIVIDETGVGGGVVDLLKDALRNGDLQKNCEIRGVQFGSSANDADSLDAQKDREKFVNMKARMFGLLADDLKNEKDGLVLLNEAVYLEELPSILYRYNQKGQMVIESKDEYKKRTGRKSPDSADSLALANFGRYDELKIGTFTKNYNNELSRPLSSGLRNERNW